MDLGNTTIRPFRPADAAGVVALWKDCGLVVSWNDPAKDIARKREWGADLFLVACDDAGVVVGTVMAGYDGHRGGINYLAVAPSLQGTGLGRELMDAAERRLLALGCPKINLLVRTSNTKVIGFYERLGFTQDACVALGKRLIPDDDLPTRNETKDTG